MLSDRTEVDGMNAETRDRHSLVLLVALLFFLVLSAFVRDDWISEIVLALAMFAVLVIAILEVSDKRTLPWPAASADSIFPASHACMCLPSHTRPADCKLAALDHFFWLCLRRSFLVLGKGGRDHES